MGKKKAVKNKIEATGNKIKIKLPEKKETEIKEEVFKVDKYEASYITKGRKKVLGMFATVSDAHKALDKLGAHNRKIKHITE